MQLKHRDIAAQFGNQPQRVIHEAQDRQVAGHSPEQKRQHIESALTYAREKNLERQSVVDERDLMRDSLRRSMGEANFAEVRDRFEKRVESRGLIGVESAGPARAFTTEQMIGYEKDTIAMMRAGKSQHDALV